jgi:competence protein ComGC
MARFKRTVCDEAGEGFVDVLVKMLIVVVVGAVLLAIMRVAVPQLFTDMLTKIRDIFDV